jgi:primosomal protein N' (replication factor Y)
MPTYLEISVNVPQVSGVFHYHLPPGLEGGVGPGHLVEVPFGKQAVQGVVLNPVNEPEVATTKPVSALIDPDPVLTRAQITLARQLSAAFLAPLSTCIDLMLPPGLAQQADTLYNLIPQPQPGLLSSGQRYYELSELQNRLVNLLKKRGPLRGRQVDTSLPKLDWRPAAQALIKRGFLSASPVLPPPAVHPKNIRTAVLGVPPEDAEAAMDSLGKAGSDVLRRRQSVLRALMDKPEPVQVAWVYAESGGALPDLKYLAERGLVILSESEVWRDPLSGMDVAPTAPLHLLHDQQTALDEIDLGIQQACEGKPVKPFLLFGVTGSGKTEIYLQAVNRTLELGRQAIILVPEIALTPQTVRRFLSRFPGRVGLVHSRLSEGERYDTWRRARLGLLSVIVGPRSALYTPCPNIGLIVLDEAHDDSYYQSETDPHYDTRLAAEIYARLAGAACLFGTATPAISTRYRALREGWKILDLPQRIMAHKQVVEAQAHKLGKPPAYKLIEGDAEMIALPPVQVVDMREELKDDNRSIFSRKLQQSLKTVLDQGQQAILFLNRRGTATYVFCRECGYTLRCPRCDLPMTLHSTRPEAGMVDVPRTDLRCHFCGYERTVPKRCPQCTSDKIRQYGTGTEAVETQVQQLFPKARTLRWDYETTRKKGAHEIILSHFANHHADILIGTQMIAKGLDLPLVTLVGMVLADVGLNLPDYRAPERTFSLLMQVAGRAGRSPLGGEVVLQTFQPDHYVIQAASRHDYLGFYRQELDQRKRLGYPPYSRMVKLEYRHFDPQKAERTARALADQMKTRIKKEERRSTEIIGPTPCFFERIGGSYRWQVILRGPDPVSLLKQHQIRDWHIEIDPISLL